MGMISPEILQQLYGKWQERLNQNDGELLKKIICIDGKTMRSNKRKEEKAHGQIEIREYYQTEDIK